MSINIVDRRRASFRIRLLPSAGRVEKFAAKELAWYLYKMSKCGICIEESFTSSDKEIFLVSTGNCDEDSFVIEAGENSILLSGSNPRSVLFAVYEFLEHLGCAFPHPFDEYIPEKPIIETEEFSMQWKASFRERGLFQAFFLLRKNLDFDGFIPQRRLPQIAFLAKNKCNTFIFSCDYNRLDLWDKFKYQIMDELLDRGLKIAFVSATMDFFCPESFEKDFGEYGVDSYITKRPKWYENNVIRPDLPEVQEFIARRYTDFLLSHPEFSTITFAPRKEIISKVFVPENSSLTDVWMSFFNAVARYLAKYAPGRKLSVMVHNDLLSLGESSIVPEKNICFIFRTDDKINMHYSFLAPENAEVKKAFDLLAAKGNEMYFINGSGETGELAPYWKMAGDLYKYCKEKNVVSVWEFGGHTYNILALNFRRCVDYFCCTRLMADENADTEKCLEKWADALYGGSGKYIRDYYKEMAEEHGKLASAKSFGAKDKWLTLSSFRRVQKNLAFAKEALTDVEKLKMTGEKIDFLEVLTAKSVKYSGTPGFEKEDEFMK